MFVNAFLVLRAARRGETGFSRKGWLKALVPSEGLVEQCPIFATFLPPKGLVEENVRFLPPLGLADENFINQPFPVPRRRSINFVGALPRGLLEGICAFGGCR